MEVSSYGFGVDQGSIQFILDALLATVQPCFGPRAGSVAVKTNTGTSLITCNGAAILRFLLDTSIEHPVAKFIVKSVLEHAERYGDGSKRLLLMLSAGWRERKRRLTPDEARQLVHVARTLTNNTSAISLPKERNGDMCQSVLGKLLWSVLNEQFPSAICKTLQTLVIEWLTRFWDTGLSITSLSAPFPILVLPGNSLLSSYSTGGSYLIPLERLEQVARIRKLLAVFNSCSTGIRFIAFNEALELKVLDSLGGTPERDSRVNIVHSRVDQRQRLLQGMLQRLQKDHINLVLCTNIIESSINQFLFEHEIVCIPHCCDEAVDYLMHSYDKLPVPTESFWTQWDEYLTHHTVGGLQCDVKILGGKRFLQLLSDSLPPQILLRCQSSAFGEQYHDAMIRCFKSVKHAVQNISESLTTEEDILTSNCCAPCGLTEEACAYQASTSISDIPASILHGASRSISYNCERTSNLTMSSITGTSSQYDTYDLLGHNSIKVGFSLGFLSNERPIMEKAENSARRTESLPALLKPTMENVHAYDSWPEIIERVRAFSHMFIQLDSLDFVILSHTK